MVRRGLGILVVMVLLAGSGLASAPFRTGEDELEPTARKARFDCQGLDHREVRGSRPTYTKQKLADFRNHERMCRAVWLPRPRRHLVPQGLAVSGATAWVSGFGHTPRYGDRPCRLMNIDLRTGRLLAYRFQVVGAVGGRPATYCRHGGGLLRYGNWLWIVEQNKLWLVNLAAARGTTLRATRVWRIAEPIRGSSIVTYQGRVGLVPFRNSGTPHIYWFDIRRLVRPGVLDLVPRTQAGRDRKRLGSVARTPVPTHVQGATIGPEGLYLSRSNLTCGELVTPRGRRLALIPGAEGVQFGARGERLWVVSESGARPYAGARKPMTPAVSSFEWPGLSRGKTSSCRF
jgi:hypothetical protein